MQFKQKQRRPINPFLIKGVSLGRPITCIYLVRMGITGGWVVIEPRLLRGLGMVNVRSGVVRRQTVNVGRLRASAEPDGKLGLTLGSEVRVGLAVVEDGAAATGEVPGLSRGGGTLGGNSGPELLGRGGGVGAGGLDDVRSMDDVRSGVVRLQTIDIRRLGTAAEPDGEVLVLGNGARVQAGRGRPRPAAGGAGGAAAAPPERCFR